MIQSLNPIYRHLVNKPKLIPILWADAALDWIAASVAMEEQQRRWAHSALNMDYYEYKGGLYGAVDTVHLIQVSCGIIVVVILLSRIF